MSTSESNVPVYSIGTVARMLDVSVETLRLYERKGLCLVHKNESNQRLYSDADVARLRCIRAAIRDEKISVEGIRRLHSLIPCWKHIDCPMEQRLVCPAYHKPQAGCWTHRHVSNVCAAMDCRTCSVYVRSANCNELRQLVHEHRSEETVELHPGT